MRTDLSDLKEQLKKLGQENKLLHEQLANLRLFEKLSNLSELTFEGVFFHKAGICLEVNQALCNMSGYERSELIGKNFLDIFVADEYKEISLENMKLDYAGPHHIQVKKKDGAKVDVDVESKFFNFEGEKIRVTIMRDISEQIRSERALIESEEKYKTAFKTNPDAVNINKLDGVFVDINEGFTKITGYTREDVIGKSSADINIWAIPEDREILLNGLKTSGLVENLESVFRYKNGNLRTCLISARLLRINDEPHILSITRDISQRKTMENELVAAKEKAEESDRLKSAFLANMSHEIRTPMNALVGFVELMTQQNISDEKRKFYSNVITDSCQRLLNIINDILDISKIETHQYKIIEEETNLNDVMLESFSLFLHEAKQKGLDMHLEKSLRDSESFVILDIQKLRQVLNNLISNAIKFTQSGDIHVGYKIEKNELKFYVKDSGIGIPPEHHELIFDRFRQVESTQERKYGGTGLGLSIAKGFVELMKGKIWCESEEGTGSEFYFTIPYIPGTGNQTDIDAKTVKPEDKLSNTVLVVEDEEINYLYIEELLLRMENINILRAINGVDAVNMAIENLNIDLVLMDIKMPLMDGYEATRKIKKKRPDLPIVAQTAYAMPDDEVLAKQAGCDAYISKPIQKERFIGIVTSFLLKK